MSIFQTCHDVIDKSSSYLDGELEKISEIRVKVHLAMCPGCKRYYQQMKVVVDSTRNLPGHDHAMRVQNVIESVLEKVCSEDHVEPDPEPSG